VISVFLSASLRNGKRFLKGKVKSHCIIAAIATFYIIFTQYTLRKFVNLLLLFAITSFDIKAIGDGVK
jgi:hypothetical protein